MRRASQPLLDRSRLDHEPSAIDARYLLLTLLPFYERAEDGSVWTERIWFHDLNEHFRYLRNVALAAPGMSFDDAPPGSDLVRLEAPSDVSLTLVPLPPMRSTKEGVLGLGALGRRLWRSIADADVVHSGVAGWPFPPGWVANTIALLHRRPLVLVIESAPWRLTGASHEGARDRARAIVTEALARFFAERADLCLFTQPDYRRTLAGRRSEGCHVIPAAWINDEDVLTPRRAAAAWAEKRERTVSLLFAGRLVPSKGVEVLLDALRMIDARGIDARVDVIGEGPLRDACVDARAELAHVDLRVLDPVPYGQPFHALVRRYHAVLVPNLGDEQPRIVFDAFAQAVPVIAFDTDGLRPHVAHGDTGWLVDRIPEVLARAIERALRSGPELERMGMRARSVAPRFTHRAMHRARWRLLTELLERGARN